MTTTSISFAAWLRPVARLAKPGVISTAALAMSMSISMAVGAVTIVGCGNYSNEDLEFMSAIPERDDVTVELPRQSSLANGIPAPAWVMTVEVTRTFNDVADAFLSLIDKVRGYYPTSRAANTRTWGPFPAENNPGWQVEFRMAKSTDVGPPQFDYELVMIPPAGFPPLLLGGVETRIIAGRFDASGGARVGTGHLIMTIDEARAAGIVLKDLDRLRTLTIDYRTRDWPRQVMMTIENLPPLVPTDLARTTYVYERAENGDGAMTFSFPGQVLDGPAGLETLVAESRWLGSGRGREDVSVSGGDLGTAVATSLECWNDSFQSVFKSQSGDMSTTGNPVDCIQRP